MHSAILVLTAAVGWMATRPRSPSPAVQQAERARTPQGFVYVPGGEAWLGTGDADADDDARPGRRVFVGSFYIGRCEVTQAEWKRFRPTHVVPAGYEGYPITNVTRQDAEAYCRFMGGRLPTDAEWEKAARGTDGRRYPWGDVFDPRRCNLVLKRGLPPGTCRVPGTRKGLKPSESYPDGASPYGALNMAGNAWEWVEGAYRGNRAQQIIRGGAVGYSERDARAYTRGVEGAGVT